MNWTTARRIARAILYEGYMLYPYRPSAIKNQQRFNFGVVYPQAYSEAQKGSDPWIMQTECLVQGSAQTRFEICLRFLQLSARVVQQRIFKPSADLKMFGSAFAPVRSLEVDGQAFYSWEEAVERELNVPESSVDTLVRRPLQQPITLKANQTVEPLADNSGGIVGRLVRTQEPIDGGIYVAVYPVVEGVYRIVVRVRNITSLNDADHVSREDALMRSLVSAHLLLGVQGGRFVSLIDPPEALRDIAPLCRNIGAFPVLVGDEGQCDTMLSSPIILYDYPQIAPESAGELFDGTEIDEILSLRIMTMTDQEKLEMRQSDDRARQILERTETLPEEQFRKLHGVLRGLRPVEEESR
jgi:hypothetical protein